jgi:hypothetical protein
MKLAIKNMVTGIDGETHDVVRVSIAVVALIFPILILWGVGMVSYCTISGTTFDITAIYSGFSLIIASFGTFLVSGAGAIYMKRSTEPEEKTNQQ